jgi:hypothetical protein
MSCFDVSRNFAFEGNATYPGLASLTRCWPSAWAVAKPCNGNGLSLSGGAHYLLEVFTWLPSNDVLKCAACCREFSHLLNEEAHAFWSSCETQPGFHDSSCVWLHTIASTDEVASYMRKVRRATIIGALEFESAQDIMDLARMLEYGFKADWASHAKGHTEDEQVNLCISKWSFKVSDVQSFSDDGVFPQRISSTSIVEAHWGDKHHNEVSFEVRLALCKVGCGQFAFAWDVSFMRSMPSQDDKPLDVCVKAYAKVRTSSGKEEDHLLRVMPFMNLTGPKLFQKRLSMSSDHSGFGSAGTTSHFTRQSEIFLDLLAGEPVVCAGRIDLRYGGVEQVVTYGKPA